ncbi:MAG TPA: hypothetical protein VK610_00735 [Rhodothermales bacterium]|nr:hypothetical protein [Rhodothermales bacterium]
MSLLLAATLIGLVKTVLVAALAALNALLALLASIAIWKTYLAVGLKLALVALVCVPVIGIIVFALWGRKTVRANQR